MKQFSRKVGRMTLSKKINQMLKEWIATKILEVLIITTSSKLQFSRKDGKLVCRTTDCFKTTFHFTFSTYESRSK